MVRPGAYRGSKRQKELKRLQKQEEKRQKRLQKKTEKPGEPEISPTEPPPFRDDTSVKEPSSVAPDEQKEPD